MAVTIIQHPLFQPRTRERRTQRLGGVRRKCYQSVFSIICCEPADILTGVMIGTGLLYDSGELLSQAGPISLLMAYILMGTVVYATQVL